MRNEMKSTFGGRKSFIGVVVAVIIAAAIIGGIIYKISQANDRSDQQTIPVNQIVDEPQKIDLRVVEYKGIEGKNVLDLLKTEAKIEYTDSASGAFITSINGIVNSDKEFWLYSVNGADATVAADKYVTKDGDAVKWEYKGF